MLVLVFFFAHVHVHSIPATQVTRGVTRPLEVFRHSQKGWAVRCAEDIPVGAFVCAYIGELVLEDEVCACKLASSK